MNTTVNKAVVAVLGGILTLIGVIAGESVVSWATPEIVSAIGGLITAGLVYFIPNAEAPVAPVTVAVDTPAGPVV